MLKVYFKPNCSTCRTALQLIKDATTEKIETIEYLVETPSVEELNEIVLMLGVQPEDIVRKKEPLFKEKYEGKKISGKQWLKILNKNPILIERPIIISGNKAIIGRPVEKIIKFFEKKTIKKSV
ncbi:MAG: arsenate reductase (glutaredoxin) [Bacteroidetes bacterium]|nr:arsenate reductase (glutaredoxin) [Bacteroidota bacterium]